MIRLEVQVELSDNYVIRHEDVSAVSVHPDDMISVTLIDHWGSWSYSSVKSVKILPN